MKHIYKCPKHGYTMKVECCNKQTIDSKPVKFSPDDKYGKYRREVKEGDRKKKGLL